MKFDYERDWKTIDCRAHPELYIVGKGEQGVLLIEPYKSELLPLWRVKTPEIAESSANALKNRFLDYKKAGDFAGMDMARKFLQMGYTRARRYANHASGKKYAGPVPANKAGKSGAHGRPVLPIQEDSVKAKSAAIFKVVLSEIEGDVDYKKLLQEAKLREKE